jgi:capsular polysaccharide biosynthesis protein
VTLHEILAALRRRSLLVGSAIIVALLAGGVIAAAQGSNYRAETEILLSQPAIALPGDSGALTQQKLNLLAVTYAHVVAAKGFVITAAQQAGTRVGDASVSAEAVQGASIVKLSVSSSSRGRSVAVARAVESSLHSAVAGGQSGVAAGAGMSTQTLTEPVAKSASASRVFTLLAALVAGAAIGITAALALELSD